ncbi:MAG: CARDB domain-containing protein, partial [Candidatus Thermoplasmatota archaeon]
MIDEVRIYNRALSYEDITVKFYDGNPATGGTLIGTKIIPSIPVNSSTTTSINWTPTTAGTHIIYVVVDPDNLIAEANETNNVAWKDIYVT